MGGGGSKSDDTQDNNRKKRTDEVVTKANEYENNIRLSSGITDTYLGETKSSADDAQRYATDINTYVNSLQDAIDKAGTQYEKDDYEVIKKAILPYQSAANDYASNASYPNTYNIVKYNSESAQKLIEPATAALNAAKIAKDELYKLGRNDNIDLKQREATTARKNSEFLLNLYSTGVALLDLKGSKQYELDSLALRDAADSNEKQAELKKTAATTEYNNYTTLKSRYGDSVWLAAEIKKNEDAKKVAETKKKNIDDPELLKDQDAKSLKEDELLAAIKDMQKSKSGGSAYDKKEAELLKLTGEKEEWIKKQTEYEKIGSMYDASISAINTQSLIDLIASKTIQENAAKEAVRLSQKKILDLSGEIIDLSGDILNITNTISEDELNIDKLNNYIQTLNDRIIDLTEQNYSNKVYNNENLLKLNESVDQDLQYIFSDLKTQNINPKLLHSKIKYREVEEEKLLNTNKVLDILFYCFYFSFIIISIVTRNAKIEHFLIYIFIGLIPFVYPFVFKNTKNILHMFHLDGNKNAFIENENTFDSYNI